MDSLALLVLISFFAATSSECGRDEETFQRRLEHDGPGGLVRYKEYLEGRRPSECRPHSESWKCEVCVCGKNGKLTGCKVKERCPEGAKKTKRGCKEGETVIQSCTHCRCDPESCAENCFSC